MSKLRYLPTNEELRLSTLTPEQRKRREMEDRRLIPVYDETVRILLAKGLNPSSCPIWHCREAYAEAKRRLGPDPLIT